jgi:hypothetical protein
MAIIVSIRLPLLKGEFMNQGKYITEYSQRLLILLEEKIIPGQESFGFEYEFLPRHPLSLDIMQQIYRFLPEYALKGRAHPLYISQACT